MRHLSRSLLRWTLRHKSPLLLLALFFVFFQAGLWAGYTGVSVDDNNYYPNPFDTSFPVAASNDDGLASWLLQNEPLEDDSDFMDTDTDPASSTAGAPRGRAPEFKKYAVPIRGLKEHPIPRLMEEAEVRYREKITRQSRTLQDAVVEYKRRYSRDPPEGFDRWWKFAQENDVLMVDEYDGLMDDLEPFWSLSGEELRRRAWQAGQLPAVDLVRIVNGTATAVHVQGDSVSSEVSARANGFKAMLSKFVSELPDMDFPINAKAEGRVLVPWEHQVYPNSTLQNSSEGLEAMLGGPFKEDWGDTGSVWDAYRRTCPPHAPARRLLSSQRNIFSRAQSALSSAFALSSAARPHHAHSHHTLPLALRRHTLTPPPAMDFAFVRASSAHALDFCAQPHLHALQGHFFSDWRTVPALYPIFSPARAAGFLDVRIPSHYYYGSTKRYTYGWDEVNMELREERDNMEVPWEWKSEKIFWRGASTGGGNHPPGFSPQYQRHRFLRMASDRSTTTNRTVVFPYYISTSTSSSSGEKNQNQNQNQGQEQHPLIPPESILQKFVATTLPVAKLNEEIMDAAFVKILAAETYPGGLEAMMRDHRFGDGVPLGKHWAYKYLVDMDGTGYSGRFMAFLASDSVPIKATVYKEFFDDWIQPWVHFIPLSSSYNEIYNVHAYFSGAPLSALQLLNSSLAALPQERRLHTEGDRRLRRIARAGKEWKRRVARKVDMEAYVFRLCLEWGRLWTRE